MTSWEKALPETIRSSLESPIQLDVRGLSKVYKENRGLLATSFCVAKGELIAVVGHNGAGKSTLLKLLGGWLVPDSGEVRIDGIDLENRRALVRKIGFAPETPALFDFFSVEYNLALFARLFRIPFSQVEAVMDEFSLLPFRQCKVNFLSKGLKQRVSIGRSLLADPSLLLFDEPTSGLDFEMTNEVYVLLEKIHSSGKTILFTSHRPEEIQALATRIMVLHQGTIVFDGSPADYFESRVHQHLYS
ncbi:ABC transporter ATP-binding protein [Seongchinamella unica]|uniref:ABC transporter ATP-binding protein n=1 Tax=Seongchinamella unica TaxID=2547392 RepID=A0A4R5LTF4_9GAMM|nr:ABC transporter ATP-binding protein [Seongchinamella unica]TDG14191.1 ABC transporter ATP-binding protein [Seongchinamella unica]